ncbi:MAG TPA: aldehyde dehydrogenase family protein [Candidatus Sphingobacterium stercoripullorum]|nr:aldehyde dehydrogenase family protein [Candidatus Sphingobacterium stercoripullorum]
MIIGGKKVSSGTGRKIDVISPVTRKVIAHLERADETDVDKAVNSARNTLDGEWGRVNAIERGKLLLELSQCVLKHKEELAEIESADTGKTKSTAMADIKVLARYFEFYGGGADKIMGQVIPYLNEYNVQVVREPLGVTAHILPWNYPAQMFGRSVAPALAMGNAVVVKPAEDACLSILRVAELALDVGFPAGALNVVTGLGAEAGAALSLHPGIDFISFTGSNEVGKLIQKAAAENAVKCVLELGGKSAHIVFEDADFERAVPTIAKGIIYNAGQTCSAGSRVLIHESIFEEFTERIAEEFRAASVGNSELDLACGPVINESQYNKINRYLEQGVNEGDLKLVAQGKIHPSSNPNGFFIKPSFFVADEQKSPLFFEEIFGPVLVAAPFGDDQEAVKLANETGYGLLNAIWTEVGSRQQRLARQLKCGQVYINGFGAGGGVELPFGGVGKSGHGREKGFMALEEMSTVKTVVMYCGNN